jgi:glucosamine--fructose-6-phosphate aminotransferase (isomerizing)
VLPTHPAEGIVMTASASVMLLAGLRLAGVTVGEATVAAAETLLAGAAPLLLDLVAGRSHVVFVGGGGLHGVAQEGAIKLQEMSLTFAQAYHPLEYRHGPIALVDDRTLAVALFDTDARPEELALVADIRDKGGRVLGLGGPGDVSLSPGGEPGTRGLVCLPVIQALGEAMARVRGIDTAAPRHLRKVVILSGV